MSSCVSVWNNSACFLLLFFFFPPVLQTCGPKRGEVHSEGERSYESKMTCRQNSLINFDAYLSGRPSPIPPPYSASLSTRSPVCTSSTRSCVSRGTSSARRRTCSLHASARTSSALSRTSTDAPLMIRYALRCVRGRSRVKCCIFFSSKVLSFICLYCN